MKKRSKKLCSILTALALSVSTAAPLTASEQTVERNAGVASAQTVTGETVKEDTTATQEKTVETENISDANVAVVAEEEFVFEDIYTTTATAITLKKDEAKYLRFVPEKSGKYHFSSSENSDGNILNQLYDANKNILYSTSSSDVYMDYRLEAGKTYYLKLTYSSSSSDVCTLNVTAELRAEFMDLISSAVSLVLSDGEKPSGSKEVTTDILYDNYFDKAVKVDIKKEGIYKFEVSNAKESLPYYCLEFFNSEGYEISNILGENDYSDEEIQKQTVFVCLPVGEYYMALDFNYHAGINIDSYNVSVEKTGDIEELADEGVVNISAAENSAIRAYKFVAPQSTTYNIKASDGCGFNYNYIFNENMEQICRTEYVEDESLYCAKMVKGKTYYIFVEVVRPDSNTGLSWVLSHEPGVEDYSKTAYELKVDEREKPVKVLSVPEKERISRFYDALVSFNAPEDGVYTFKVKTRQTSFYDSKILDSDGNILESTNSFNSTFFNSDMNNSDEEYKSYTCIRHLNAGQYYIGLEGSYSDEKFQACEISASYAADRNVKDGDELFVNIAAGVSANELGYYEFVPEKTEVYDIYSKDSISDVDGYLYDENMKQIAYSSYVETQNSYGTNRDYNNFHITEELTAGKTYYIKPVYSANTSSNGVKFTLCVNHQIGFEDLLPTDKSISIPAGNTQSAQIDVTTSKLNDRYYDKLVSFTASEDGYYTFSIDKGDTSYSNNNIHTLLDSSGNKVAYVRGSTTSYNDGQGSYKYKNTVGAYVKKGTYYLALEYGSDINTSYKIDVKKEIGIKSLKVTKKADAPGLVYKQGGNWYSEYNSENIYTRYYKFYDNNITNEYDIKIIMEDGAEWTYNNYSAGAGTNYNYRVNIDINQGPDNQWTPDNDNKVMTVVADGFREEIKVPVAAAPKASKVELSLVEGFSLYIGIDGNWVTKWDPENQEYINQYFEFYLYNSAYYNVKAKITFDDGSQKEIRLNDSVWSGDSDYNVSNNQSSTHPWLPANTDNLITVTVDGITASINIPVLFFSEQFESATELTLNKSQQIQYKYNIATSGAVSFTPDKDGTYYFYSTGVVDTKATLYEETGETVGSDDDSYDGANFKIAAELKAGYKYILLSRTYDWIYAGGDYEVTVTDKDVTGDSSYDLSGIDLSGKYINVAFVIDTTSSMGEEIAAVRDNLKSFVDALEQTKATLRISLIDYKDISENADGPDSTVVHHAPSMSVWYENEDMDDLKKEIGKLEARGGGDEPESLGDALSNITNEDAAINFNAQAAKFVFVVTDASYKDTGSDYNTYMYNVIPKLKAQNIATSVITGKGSKGGANLYSTYSNLTSQTGGILMNIESDFKGAMGRFAFQIAKDTADYDPDKDIVQVEKISLGDDLTIPEGKKRTFTPVIYPENATDKRVDWEVEDESIAKISTELSNSKELVIQGIKNGSTRILARSKDGGYTAYFNLTVTKEVQGDNIFESCYMDSVIAGIKDDTSKIKDYIYYDDLSEDSVLTVAGDVQKTIYQTIKENSKNISLIRNDGYGELVYGWKFAGSNITDAEVEVKFGIEVNKETSEGYEAAKKSGWEKYAAFDFEHEGKLPGTATVSVAVEGLEDGTFDLYHYDTNTKKYSKCGTAEVTGNIATFDITHCSSYAIAAKGKTTVIKGDLDNNTRVELADVTLALKAALKLQKLTDEQLEAADVDGTPGVALSDVTLILKAAIKLTTL